MRLESFRVQNFRSINDSGEINVSQITALLGRNESGKSNLLRALSSLNPPGGFEALNPIKDFPRHRRLEECNDNTPVLSTRWSFDASERAELGKLFPRAASVTQVDISRRYIGNDKRWVGFVGLSPLSLDAADIKAKARKIGAAIKAAADKLEAPHKESLERAANVFEEQITRDTSPDGWATEAIAALGAVRKALAAADTDLTDKQEQLISELEDLAQSIAGDDKAWGAARSWAVKKLPVFILLEEYPELNGHQNIQKYISHRDQNTLTVAQRNFEKLCKVAGLDPQNLNNLLNNGDHETRNQLANRAGSVVTAEIKRLWRDRALKIRFNLDGHHLDTLISDPTATYDVEVNLNERSRGFQWFFSFYITFSADTNGGDAEQAILLLDEPGLYLHAKSQSDLLKHFETDFKNQILYTTHSPFMVPTHSLDSIRTVNIAETAGTTVTNDPSGDSRTLFPLQAALGYDLAQSLFIGPKNLVVEGITDFWFLSAISQLLADRGGESLNAELTITPAGGAQKVPYMVALLSSEKLNVLVLLDEEKDSKGTRDDLVKTKLIAEKNVIFVTEAFAENAPAEADIEDILDEKTYIDLVKESYKRELKGKTLTLNAHIPRVAKRVELALRDLDIEFHKTRPTRLFLAKMSTSPDEVLSSEARARFEKLFGAINKRLA
jgi:predicted ATP-dependent endonuclease of OLD family